MDALMEVAAVGRWWRDWARFRALPELVMRLGAW
jgi:hypothetical protein